MSAEAKIFFNQLRRAGVEKAAFDLERERRAANALGTLTAVAENIELSEITIQGVRTLHLTPAKARPDRQLVLIHGGAFGLMSPESHERFAGHIANACQTAVFIPDYSLAPEHPFPKAIEETNAIVSDLIERETNSDVKTILVGESAGGAIALSCLMDLASAKQELPGCAVLICPWLDLSLTGGSIVSNKHKDVILTKENLEMFADYYLDETEFDQRNPRVSPLFGDLHNLPAIYCQAAEHDILLDDAMRLQKALERTNTKAETDIFPEMCHSFQFFAGQFPESKMAIDKIAEFVDRHA